MERECRREEAGGGKTKNQCFKRAAGMMSCASFIKPNVFSALSTFAAELIMIKWS